MAAPDDKPPQLLSLRALIGLVVGSMIGSGIFALPSAFGRTTGVLGALIAWCIAGGGMLMLAFVFQSLSRRRPDLDSGIYSYAQAGFGSYLGFASALGYWTGCCLADVACLVLIKSTLGMFIPLFGDGTTPAAILGATAILWGFHCLVLRGIKEAAAVNTAATVAKIVPIVLFLLVVIGGFRPEVFAANWYGTTASEPATISQQVRNTMLVTVFVFVGIEGASVYSRYARDRRDVGLATVLGFLSVLCLLVLVTVLSYGILPQAELAGLRNPSMAGVMEAVVGPWGAVFISIGLLISVLGNYLSWSLLAAEVLHSAARDGAMPAFLARENRRAVPAAALWMTNLVIQFFLILTSFAEDTFKIALKMTSSMTLIPYLLVAAFGLQLTLRGETYEAEPHARRNRDLGIAVIATLYAAGMILAGGTKFVLLSTLIYAPGTILYVLVRREQGERVFRPAEWALFLAILAAAVFAVEGLASGRISV